MFMVRDFVKELGKIRACSHGGWGPREGEVPCLGGVPNLSFFLDLVHMRSGVVATQAGCPVSRAGEPS